MPNRKPVYLMPGASEFELSRLRFDAIIESSYDGIYITDGQANTIIVNRSYEAISGLNRADMLGRNMRDLVAEGAISSSGTLLALQRREAVTLDQEFKTGKKAVITSTPAFDADGSIVMVVTNVRDITEMYHMKEQLRQSKHEAQRYYSEIEFIRGQLKDAGDLIAEDKNTLGMLRMVSKVAKMDTTVILLGETGVGKEKIAGYIYENSRRAQERFIKVNCGAIPDNLIESELFGYERGAFTGANKNGKMGLFEVADKGTIFLDEVGELPMNMQVKLLRVLQEQEIERIGANKPVKIDVRVLAATNRNLEQMVDQKLFREDLYYRLNVFPIVLPPLRERPDDILPLARNMLASLNKKYGLKKELTQLAGIVLEEYRWPGNVRELKNIVERAVIMSNDDLIDVDDLSIRPAERAQREAPDGPIDLKQVVEQIEIDYITRAYQKYKNVRAAARSLGMDPATFVRKRQKYGERCENET